MLQEIRLKASSLSKCLTNRVQQLRGENGAQAIEYIALAGAVILLLGAIAIIFKGEGGKSIGETIVGIIIGLLGKALGW